MIQITNNLVESEERKFNDDSMTTLSDSDQSENDDSEDDEAFLARFDEDGRCIGLVSNWSHGTVLLPPELLKVAVCAKFSRTWTKYVLLNVK